LRASWEKVIEVGGYKTNVHAEYDYEKNKEFLKELSFKGDLLEPESADEVRVGYELTRDFSTQQTDVKLTASSGDYSLTAAYDTSDQVCVRGWRAELAK